MRLFYCTVPLPLPHFTFQTRIAYLALCLCSSTCCAPYAAWDLLPATHYRTPVDSSLLPFYCLHTLTTLRVTCFRLFHALHTARTLLCAHTRFALRCCHIHALHASVPHVSSLFCQTDSEQQHVLVHYIYLFSPTLPLTGREETITFSTHTLHFPFGVRLLPATHCLPYLPYIYHCEQLLLYPSPLYCAY